MGDVTNLFPNQDIPSALREIAREIEAGELTVSSEMTIISMPHVFQIGRFDKVSATEITVFNCNYAISKLMSFVHKVHDEE